MSSYKLEYFDVRGRGESIRYLLIDNGIEFEEVLIMSEQWPKYKSKMPFEQCPALYDGDLQLVQSNSILRYLGRNHAMYPSDSAEAYRVDMLNDGVEDLRVKYSNMIYLNYEAGKEGYLRELPEKLKPLENILSKNGAAASGLAVGGKLSFVDYNLFDLLDNQVVLDPSCLNNLPTLKSYYSKFKSRSKLAVYRESDAFKSRKINGNNKQ